MNVKQVYELVNTATQEMTGEISLLAEDLSNVVDVGREVLNAGYDKFVKSLTDKVGRVIFVARKYSGTAPNVLMDSWEYGSIMQKISIKKLLEATENEMWELEDGTSYDPNVFHKPDVSEKFFDKTVTFEVDDSITEDQVKSAFNSASELSGFVAMIFNHIDTTLTVQVNGLIKRTVNNFIAETIYSEYPTAQYSAGTGVRVRNLLKEYNDINGTSITKDDMLATPGFLRYVTEVVLNVSDQMAEVTALYNVEGNDRFTPKDMQKVILLSQVANAMKVNLQSDVYHNELTAFPMEADKVTSWQGIGSSFAFDDCSTIKVKTATGHDVDCAGVIGFIFDRDALGVTNLDRRVDTHYNAKANFTNYFYKMKMGHFNDLGENACVLIAA